MNFCHFTLTDSDLTEQRHCCFHMRAAALKMTTVTGNTGTVYVYIPIYVDFISSPSSLIIANNPYLCPILHTHKHTHMHIFHGVQLQAKPVYKINKAIPRPILNVKVYIIEGVLIIGELLAVERTTLFVHGDG
jgi:hypothetical protein